MCLKALSNSNWLNAIMVTKNCIFNIGLSGFLNNVLLRPNSNFRPSNYTDEGANYTKVYLLTLRSYLYQGVTLTKELPGVYVISIRKPVYCNKLVCFAKDFQFF